MPCAKTPLKYPGGKAYLADKIVALMPPHVHYVEPYFGGGSVLLGKSPAGTSEVANDLDGDLTNFWRVLQDEHLFGQLRRRLEATPFSEPEWRAAAEELVRSADPVARAWAYFVRCRQSMMGMGDTFAPLSRRRVRRGMNEQASAWLGAVEGLGKVHERLKRVVVLNRDALDVIRGQDGPDTLFYLDPPYLHETRESTELYANEMSPEQHRELLDVLATLEGTFLLSGYRSALYDGYAERHGWVRHDFPVDNKMGTGDTKRQMVECVWTNAPAPPPAPVTDGDGESA